MRYKVDFVDFVKCKNALGQSDCRILSFIISKTIVVIKFRDVSRDYLGIVVFIAIGRVTKCEGEGMFTLQSSESIRRHNEI